MTPLEQRARLKDIFAGLYFDAMADWGSPARTHAPFPSLLGLTKPAGPGGFENLQGLLLKICAFNRWGNVVPPPPFLQNSVCRNRSQKSGGRNIRARGKKTKADTSSRSYRGRTRSGTHSGRTYDCCPTSRAQDTVDLFLFVPGIRPLHDVAERSQTPLA